MCAPRFERECADPMFDACQVGGDGGAEAEPGGGESLPVDVREGEREIDGAPSPDHVANEDGEVPGWVAGDDLWRGRIDEKRRDALARKRGRVGKLLGSVPASSRRPEYERPRAVGSRVNEKRADPLAPSAGEGQALANDPVRGCR